jgi:hypothetical protein
VHHPRPPEAIRRHADSFGFNVLQQQLRAVLA